MDDHKSTIVKRKPVDKPTRNGAGTTRLCRCDPLDSRAACGCGYTRWGAALTTCRAVYQTTLCEFDLPPRLQHAPDQQVSKQTILDQNYINDHIFSSHHPKRLHTKNKLTMPVTLRSPSLSKRQLRLQDTLAFWFIHV